jgi:transposase
VGWDPARLWKTYIQLMDAKAAFRTLKSDLGTRPIWHQKQNRVQARILVCFLGYVLWKTLGQWMQRLGLGTHPRTLLKELEALKAVDVLLHTQEGQEIRLSCIAEPEPPLADLLARLGKVPPKRLRSTGLDQFEVKM